MTYLGTKLIKVNCILTMHNILDDFFEGIRMALDPLVTFGVKIVPEKENEKSQNFLWKNFLLKKLKVNTI